MEVDLSSVLRDWEKSEKKTCMPFSKVKMFY